MHADEVDVDVRLVRRLLAAQFPAWAGLPLEPVLPRGTDNALFRLGDGLVARLPRTPRTEAALASEREWLPRLAPHLPLEAPEPVADGAPGQGYPFRWAVYTWLEGENATGNERSLAADLAGLIAALRRIDPSGGPRPGPQNVHRGEPIGRRDEAVRAAIVKLGNAIDVERVTAEWEADSSAPEWHRAPVWIHGDLDARNLLARDGRLSGVLDWGCVGVGDPACDVMVAWKLLPAGTRPFFRDALGVDEATWRRARAWALSQALMALSYYTLETNAALVREAEHWLVEVLGV